jgi:peptidoglycan/xylan/chitin deacetylase (PgdA/CDA1 family)
VALAGLTVTAVAITHWPHILARAAGKVLPFDVIWHVKLAAPIVALSFDDGPSPATTPGLLEVLTRHHAHATFFIIGSRVAENTVIVSDLVAAGNEIANHSMLDRPSVKLSPGDFKRDLLCTHQILSRYAQAVLFRPGSGWFTPTMLKILVAHGYRCVLGDVMVLDSDHRQPRRQARRILRRVKPGSIIILHEGAPERRGVIELAEIVVSELRALGYEVGTVSDLLRARP